MNISISLPPEAWAHIRGLLSQQKIEDFASVQCFIAISEQMEQQAVQQRDEALRAKIQAEMSATQ